MSTLDYASPPLAPSHRLPRGSLAAVISFALSMVVAVTSLLSAHSMRYPVGRDCFGSNESVFWMYDPLLALIAGWCLVLCARAGAGFRLCRVGLLVAALMWSGSLILIRP